MNDPDDQRNKPADIFKVVVIYALFAATWILLSDWIVERFFHGHDTHAVMQSIKGLLFVSATSILLYYLLKRLHAGAFEQHDTARGGLFDWLHWQRYLFAFVITIVTLLIRQDIAVSFDEHPLLLLFMFPIALSAVFVGFGPGLLATALCVAGLSYFAIPPLGSLAIKESHNLIQMGFLAAGGLLVSYLSMMLHDARHRSDSERRKAEAHLTDKLRAMSLLDSIAEGSSDAIFAKDTEGRYMLCNTATARFAGKSVIEVLGNDDTVLFPPEQAAHIQLSDRQVMQDDRVITIQETLDTRDGSRSFTATKGPLHDQTGKVIGLFGISHDITALKMTEHALRHERDTTQRYLDTVQNIMLALDSEGRVSMLNRYGCELLGYRETDLLGYNWFQTCLPQPEGMQAVYPVYLQLMSGKVEAAERFENEVLCRDGSRRTISWHNGYLRNDAGNIVGTLSSGEDVTARKQAEDQLRKLSMAVEQSPESIVITNLDAEIEYVNEAFVRNTGYRREEVIGKNPRVLQSGKTTKTTYEAMWKNLTAGDTWEGELYNKRKDGSDYVEHVSISPIRESDGRITHYVAVKEDITQKQKVEAELNRLAFYDTLTGLPNRALLLERMAQMIALTRRSQHCSALISFNIDNFKTINDAGGQALGDALLQAVGQRLDAIMREGDVVARVAGDEFGILLTDLSASREEASHFTQHIAEKIHASLQLAFKVGQEPVSITACLGIALFPDGEQDAPLDVLRRVNTALHHAKSRGKDQTAFYEGALDEAAHYRFEIERDLRHALDTGELRAFLQLQVDAKGKTVGAEALIRWQHPQRGLIAPSAFIPIAEESNLIIDIGNWMLNQVCAMLARADMIGCSGRIAVNISPRHFRQSDFVDQIKQVLTSSGADPTHLTLEVTEGMLIDNLQDVVAKMVELSALGIHFSMDDFGTGYSSLSYLKQLPIHELKIDKTFVQDMTTDPNDAALVDIILSVAKHLHLKVVAEGVEAQEQADFLNQRGKVIHQGYLYSRPEPAENVLPSMWRKR
ncbi:MAG: EAL domain-containing protein [Gammaproteobacteria bacterium]|nr:EAL domain-containing protein [Gammaproteobacteria bacterium]MBU4150119.1 EAL domain-containing protein [Gammaproteobacteria bacterium]